jgi:hypothetical protein
VSRVARILARLGAAAVAFGLGIAACGPSTFGDYPRGAVVVAPAAAPTGWMHVEEQGWFSALFPGEPKTTFETVLVQDSHVQTKALTATDGQKVWTWVRYFEVSSLTTMLDAETLMRWGRTDFLAISGVRFLRDEPRAPGGPAVDFVCSVAPRSPLDNSDAPMVARVRAYSRTGTSTRVIFAIAVWPESATDEAARAFFEAFHVGEDKPNAPDGGAAPDGS